MGRFGRHLEAIARLQCTGWLTLYGKIKATFNDIPGLDARMRVPCDRHSRFYLRFCSYRDVTRYWTLRLCENFSCDAGGRCGWRALRGRFCRNEPGEPANRAGR